MVIGAAEERVIPPSETCLRDGAGDDDVEDTLVTERPLVTVDDEARYTPRARGKRRLARPLVGLLVVLLIAAAGLGSAYAWTRTQYFVGVSGEHVAIYQGLSDGVPGIRLSRVFEVQPLAIGDLPPYYQDQVRANIDVPNLQTARETIVELTAAAERRAAQNPPRESPVRHRRPRPRLLPHPRRHPRRHRPVLRPGRASRIADYGGFLLRHGAPAQASRHRAGLILFALVITLGAYALVDFNVTGFSDNFPYLAGDCTLMACLAHIAVRWRLPYADPVLLPCVIVLNGFGLAMIHRIDLINEPPMKGARQQLIWMPSG